MILRAMALCAAVVIAGLSAVGSDAQQVKYCKDYRTGEVFVVEAGMPCPYPTVEVR